MPAGWPTNTCSKEVKGLEPHPCIVLSIVSIVSQSCLAQTCLSCLSNSRWRTIKMEDHQDTFKVPVNFDQETKTSKAMPVVRTLWTQSSGCKRRFASTLAQLYCSSRNTVLIPLQSRTLWKHELQAPLQARMHSCVVLAGILSWFCFML